MPTQECDKEQVPPPVKLQAQSVGGSKGQTLLSSPFLTWPGR
jgi:hypothetical protein